MTAHVHCNCISSDHFPKDLFLYFKEQGSMKHYSSKQSNTISNVENTLNYYINNLVRGDNYMLAYKNNTTKLQKSKHSLQFVLFISKTHIINKALYK